MNQLAQKAVLAGLAKRLVDRGSWGGETHLQKAAYLLSQLCDVDFDFDFILYKHGPFSFELRDELSCMRTEGLMESFAPSPRYGPRLLVTGRGDELEKRFEKTMERYGESLDWIADTLGDRGVMDLERLATAMWMTREKPGAPVRSRAEALTVVKPHISLEDATESVEEIDRLIAERENGSAG
ncbi:MAG: hypothetical protein ACRDK7_04380 [Solirubrobacteraceae bacterium]